MKAFATLRSGVRSSCRPPVSIEEAAPERGRREPWRTLINPNFSAVVSPPNSRARIPALDGLRGIAVGTIVLFHYLASEHGWALLAGEVPGIWRVTDPLSRITAFGWMGVDIFFALSGFLIGGILLDSRQQPGYFRVFYTRRAYRILPLYFVLCLITVLLYRSGITQGSATHGWLFEDRLPWLAYVSFAQNVWMAQLGAMSSRMIDATWSLAIEEQFYLVLPLLLWKIKGRAVPVLILAGILLAPVLRALTWATADPSWRGQSIYLLTHTRMDALLIGVLVAWLWRQPHWAARAVLYRSSVTAAWLGLSVIIVTMALSGWHFTSAHLMTWGLSLIAIWCGALLLIALSQPESRITRVCLTPWLGALGGIAYAVYLFHQPVLGLTHWAIRGASPQLTDLFAVAVTAGALMLTIQLALLSWRWLEQPLIERGRSGTVQSSRQAA